jgi:arylsulfatase A-like enzyme
MKQNFFCLFFLFSVVVLATAQTKKPNVIIILADDLGWADLMCYGSTFYETPNLDKLATNGVKFNYAYAPSPVCSPTRASLLTGKNPVRTGVTDWIAGRQADGKAMPYEKLIVKPTAYQLALEETTLAEYALNQGYKTYFAGKWHLGEEEKFWPQNQGFQTNMGGWSKGGPSGIVNDTIGGFFTPYNNPMLKDGPAGEYITDRLTTECLDFLDKNGKENFLLMYSLYAVHNPMQAPSALVKKYQEKRKKLNLTDKDRFIKDEDWMKNESSWRRRVVQDHAIYAAMVENMDTNIGLIIQKLQQLGIDDNTIIIFTSDNGGLSTAEGSPTTNGTLRNGKGWLHEGGIRVPFILYWKGKISPSTVSDIPVTTSDIYPTLAKVLNSSYKKDKAVEGENILTQLTTEKSRTLYWHYPHYSNQGGKPGSAIRKGNLKLIYNYEDQSVEMYDVVKDVSEKNNLAAVQPKQAKQMQKELMQWLKINGAKFPDPNPTYKP